jgi:hypothetical protein
MPDSRTDKLTSTLARTAGQRVMWFEIVSPLGNDRFGPVYLARDDGASADAGARELVVLHECVPALGHDGGGSVPTGELRTAQIRREFLNLAERLCSLRHPGAVRGRFARRDGPAAWLVVDHVAGPTLTRWLARPAMLDERTVLSLLLPVVDALQAAHEMGLIHGDLSPDSIRVRPDGVGVALGFTALLAKGPGLQRLHDGPAHRYAAPERFTPTAGKLPVSGDVYSVGALLYRLCTGVEPVDGQARTAEGIDPLPPAVVLARDRFPPRFLNAIDRALARSSQDRPTSMLELRRALLGPPIDASSSAPSGTGKLALDWLRVGPRLARVASAVVVFALLFVAGRVAWRTGIVDGVGNTLFGPRNAIATARDLESGNAVPAIVVAPEAAAGQATRASIVSVLAAAERAFVAQRYTTPPLDNAFDRYLQVLAVDPVNEAALTGINRILNYYSTRATRAERDGNSERAGTLWARAVAVARTTSAEVSLTPGARLWLDAELQRLSVHSDGEVADATEWQKPSPAHSQSAPAVALKPRPGTPTTKVSTTDPAPATTSAPTAAKARITDEIAAPVSAPVIVSGAPQAPQRVTGDAVSPAVQGGSEEQVVRDSAQVRFLARIDRLTTDAATAERRGEANRARALYQTILELRPGNETASAALQRLGQVQIRLRD